MQLNLEVCKTIAVQYGLPLQFVVKEFHVFDVLGQIAMITAPSKELVFKGGTALNKVYLGKLQRFSEDIDFDLDAQSMSEVRGKCREISRKLKGYSIGEMRRVGDTIQFYCGFESPLGGSDHVRVDIAAKKILTENPIETRTALSELSVPSPLFVTGFFVYSIEDLTARKLHALCTRTEGKDIYDASNALPLCGKMRGAIKKMLESEGKKALAPEAFIEKTISAVRKADHKKLRNLTNPFIPTSSRPKDWLELKNDLLMKLETLQKEET